MTADVIKTIGAIIALVFVVPGTLILIYHLTGTCPECKMKKRLKGTREHIAILEELYETRLSYGDEGLPTARAIEAGIMALKEKRKREEESLENWGRW